MEEKKVSMSCMLNPGPETEPGKESGSRCCMLIECLDENLEILSSTRRAEIKTFGIHEVFRGLKFQTNAVIDKICGFRSGTNVCRICP